MEPSSPETLQPIANLAKAREVLIMDAQTHMPKGGIAQRDTVIATLETVIGDALAATSKHLPETPVELDPVSERAWKWLNDTGGLDVYKRQPNGCAVGIDNSQSMIDEARRRHAGCELPLQFERGDAGHLRWQADYFDVCRADRVFQHLPDPDRTLNEMLRVLKPGGRVLVVDRDWGMVAVDASDVETTRVVLNRACAGIRNGWMGRGLCGLFKKSGVINAEVQTKSISINSFAVADTLLDLRVVVDHAIAEKLVSQDVAAKWLNDLLYRDAANQFFATVTLYLSLIHI